MAALLMVDIDKSFRMIVTRFEDACMCVAAGRDLEIAAIGGGCTLVSDSLLYLIVKRERYVKEIINMAHAAARLSEDLEVLEAMAAEMNEYLKSEVLFWPMRQGNLPRLTIGGYLMREHRLRALAEL